MTAENGRVQAYRSEIFIIMRMTWFKLMFIGEHPMIGQSENESEFEFYAFKAVWRMAYLSSHLSVQKIWNRPLIVDGAGF